MSRHAFSLRFSDRRAGPHPDHTFSQTSRMSIIRQHILTNLLFCLFGSGVALLFFGCAVGPDYQPPKTSTAAQWTSNMAGGGNHGPVELAHWWQNFNDTNLDALMLTAVQSNLTLQIAEAHVREARAQRVVVSGALWPSIGSDAGYSRNLY